MKFVKLFCLLVVLWCSPAKAEQIVELDYFTRYNNNELLEVILQFNIKSGWHIFAPYQQEFGSPLKIVWQDIDENNILEESFSRTQRFDLDDFSFDGYDKKAFYKTTIKTQKPNSKLKISWLACAEECVPENIEIDIAHKTNSNFEQKLEEIADYFISSDFKLKQKLLLMLFLAFAGGIILNLMPCVFPILSIKIISLAQMENDKRSVEATFYSFGVVVSMLAIAGILFILRQFDATIGWGFQLQSPYFVLIMLFLFIILTLMMLDVINVNNSWSSKIAFLRFNNHKTNAFMTGFLAVLIASPCTAPFMGAAIAYAVMSPVYYYFPVFLFLGLGYAFPFAIIAWNPLKLRRILPKPGKWMNILKKVLSIPLIFTCIWLIWVLLAQQGVVVSGQNLKWNDFSTNKVEQALKNEQPVFIDFTAKWCITCLVNKRVALQSDEFANLVKNKNILLLRADATNQDKDVGKALNSYGRASVPLYVYYDGKSDDYLILPQIITPSILSEYLD